MSWIALATTDVLAEFNSVEKSAYDAVQGGASSKLDTITADVVERVRGAIRSGGYALGAAGTIPASLKGEAIAIARWRFLLALPRNEQLQTSEREKANSAAIDLLGKVAAREFAVEPPTAGVKDPAGNWNSEKKFPMRTHTT